MERNFETVMIEQCAPVLAQNANVVLLCMGLDEIKESEEIGRAHV